MQTAIRRSNLQFFLFPDIREVVALKRFIDSLPSLSQRQLACILAFVVGVLQATSPLGDYDFWWHLAGGRAILEQGGVLHHEPFAFTTNMGEWVMHEWGWEVMLYSLYQWMGPVGAILLKAVASGLICLLMVYLALRRGGNTLISLAMVVLAAVAMRIWLNERPQIMLPLFVLAALHLFHSKRRGYPAMLWLYPVLMLVWVNVHGSFPMGIILLALFCVTELFQFSGPGIRRSLPSLRVQASSLLALIFIISILACLLGPNGVRGALYPLDYFSGKLDWAVENVTEWHSPNWHEGYLLPLEIMVLLTIAVLAISPVSPTIFDILLLLFSTHMMLQWGRNGILFATIATPIIAVHLSAWLDTVITIGGRIEDEVDIALNSAGRPARVIALTLALSGLIVAFAQIPWSNKPEKTFALQRLPVKACEVVAQNNLQGNMLNVYHWGGYILWRFYGQNRPVFIDGRADVYNKSFWEDYRQVSQGGAGWMKSLDKYNIQYMVIESWWAVRRAIDMSQKFTCIYEDSVACVYIRNDGPNENVLTAFKNKQLLVPADNLPDMNAILGKVPGNIGNINYQK